MPEIEREVGAHAADRRQRREHEAPAFAKVAEPNSRRAQRSSTKKTNLMSPLFIPSRSVSLVPLRRRRWQARPHQLLVGRGVHVHPHERRRRRSSRTAAPPLSVRRNSRGGLVNRRAARLPTRSPPGWSPPVRRGHGSAAVDALGDQPRGGRLSRTRDLQLGGLARQQASAGLRIEEV
jgi:hypothetical protein